MDGCNHLDLVELRETGRDSRSPFPHQRAASEELSKLYTVPVEGYKASLLVLPTGGGKTFTAVNWISRIILSRNVKVLWMAQSSYLLDQATQSFVREASNILPTRSTLNIRTVSSSRSHSGSGFIELSDDVVIVTTQTATNDITKEATGFRGEKIKFKLRQWIEASADSKLFVVLDEAHHAPAYGCRTLLQNLKDIVPNLYLLGLTATPTHNDKRISGWLEEIFCDGICYQADINELYKSNILAKPEYIQKPTGKEMMVDDGLYHRIVNLHKDLPSNLVEYLAKDSARNNLIISDYITNRKEYGKTIIFADRWFQCEYIVEKLRSKNIRADSIYSSVSNSSEKSRDGQGRRDNSYNEEVLNKFKSGKLDVLVNVRMLTEGVDVPDVKTVMITRNTTSSILMTQMIGRSLRGKKAGGGSRKDHANIVFFTDNWSRLLPFVGIPSEGKEEGRVIRPGVSPIEWVSVLLVKRACRDIEFSGKEDYPSKYFVPIGWFETEYTVAVAVDNFDNDLEKTEELSSLCNSVMVYENNISSINYLIGEIMQMLNNGKLPEKWASESLNNKQLIETFMEQNSEIIDVDENNIDGNLLDGIAHIIRHIVQNKCEPEFVDFNVRDQFDIDQLATDNADLTRAMELELLKKEFYDSRKMWKTLYKNFSWFQDAYNQAWKRIGNPPEPPVQKKSSAINPKNNTAEDYRKALMSRDRRRCRCCGREFGKGVRLEIDHIVPVKLGGRTELDNLQLLCKTCNRVKGTELLNFLNTSIELAGKPEFSLIRTTAKEPVECTVKRVINFFFRAAAVSSIKLHIRKNGRHYHNWVIEIHRDNNIELIKDHEKDLLGFIKNDLGCSHVKRIQIKGV